MCESCASLSFAFRRPRLPFGLIVRFGGGENAVRAPNGEALLCVRACVKVHVHVRHSYFSFCHKVRAGVECELCLKGGKPAEAL